MFGRSPESRDFIMAFTLTCVIACGFVAYAHWFSPDGIAGQEFAKPIAVSETRGSGSTISDESPAQVIATVYECNDENGRVMSDQPCGDDAQVRHIEMPNLMQPHRRSSSSRPVEPSRSTRPGATRALIEQGASRNDAHCASIDQEIDRINARMRRGYTSREGEAFRRRLHELSEQRWNANCRQPG